MKPAIILCIALIFLTACSAHKYNENSIIKLPAYCIITKATPLSPDPNILSYDLMNCTHEDYTVLGSITIYSDLKPLITQSSFNQLQFLKYANISDGSKMQFNENGTVYKVRGYHKVCTSEYWVTESNITYTSNYLSNPRLTQQQQDMIENNMTEYYQVMIVINNNMLIGLIDTYYDHNKRSQGIEDYLKDSGLLC